MSYPSHYLRTMPRYVIGSIEVLHQGEFRFFLSTGQYPQILETRWNGKFFEQVKVHRP